MAEDTGVVAEAAEETKTKFNLDKFLDDNRDELKDRIQQAIDRAIANGVNDNSYVDISVTITDGDETGSSSLFNFDLEDYHAEEEVDEAPAGEGGE